MVLYFAPWCEMPGDTALIELVIEWRDAKCAITAALHDDADHRMRPAISAEMLQRRQDAEAALMAAVAELPAGNWWQ